MQFLSSDWVGRYRLVISDDLLEFIEQAFVEPLPPAEQGAARARALHEARGSELEIRADGHVISRSHGEQLFCVELRPDTQLRGRLSFEKAPGVTVVLECPEAGRLVAHQAGKPPVTFVAEGSRSG
jgi:hypothetical protein